LKNEQSGFTLLEVMVAMAILAVTLVALLETQGQSLVMTNYAKHLIVATLLARSKMVDLEMELYKNGFDQFDEELDGDFEEEGFPKYRWEAKVSKLKMSINLNMLGIDENNPGGLGNFFGGMGGSPGGFLPAMGSQQGGLGITPQAALMAPIAGFIQPFLDQLTESIRKVDLTIYWQSGNKEEKLTITTHFVNIPGVTTSSLQTSTMTSIPAALQQASKQLSQAQGQLPGGKLPITGTKSLPTQIPKVNNQMPHTMFPNVMPPTLRQHILRR